MKKDFKIIDFDIKYANDIFEMESKQWGVWGDEAKLEEVEENEIIRIAICDNKFAGISRGFYENGEFLVYIICIKPEFQKMGLGTQLLQDIIFKAKQQFDIKKFKAEVISVKGHANSKKLFENFGFKLVNTKKGYWGEQSPEVYCTECFCKPCICDALFYELKV